MTLRKVPYLSFDGMHDKIEAELIEAVTAVIRSKWYILGEKVSKFEKEFADYCGVEHSIGVNSGLDALIIALQCLGIGPGDEVIVASNAYVACWNAIQAVGATIVPVEADPLTYNIDHTKIEERISDKTKVIMAVHLFGRMCDMSAIVRIAEEYKLKVVEDNAQSQGAQQSGQMSASIGQISSTSFYPGKNFGALGDAGIVTTNDASMAIKAKALRNYGSHKKYENAYIGMNSRLDEIQAALLSVKLKHIDSWNVERREIAGWYNEALDHNWVSTDEDNVCHVYCIQHERRDELQKYLLANGVQTLIHYPIPPHMQASYKFLAYKEGDYPIAEKLAKESLSLPIYPGLGREDVLYICGKIKEMVE